MLTLFAIIQKCENYDTQPSGIKTDIKILDVVIKMTIIKKKFVDFVHTL